MTETEIRTRVTDPQPIIQRLLEAGFVAMPPIDQQDIILDRPDASLFRGGRKLRLRIEGDHAELTYKGPFEGASDTSRRSEVSVPIARSDIDAYISLFTALGFPVCFQIPKRRLSFQNSTGASAVLDQWPIIGWILELEGTESSIHDIARQIAPLDSFRNYRLHELFKEEEQRRGMDFLALKEEYESATGFKLGQMELILQG